MAEKGFDIVYDLMCIGVKLNIPPKLTCANKQMPKSHVITTYLRIHVERASAYQFYHLLYPCRYPPL